LQELGFLEWFFRRQPYFTHFNGSKPPDTVERNKISTPSPIGNQTDSLTHEASYCNVLHDRIWSV